MHIFLNKKKQERSEGVIKVAKATSILRGTEKEKDRIFTI